MSAKSSNEAIPFLCGKNKIDIICFDILPIDNIYLLVGI